MIRMLCDDMTDSSNYMTDNHLSEEEEEEENIFNFGDELCLLHLVGSDYVSSFINVMSCFCFLLDSSLWYSTYN